MRPQVVAAIYIVAVLVVVSVGYFWYQSPGSTNSVTTTRTNFTSNGTGIMQCTLEQQIVYRVTYTGTTTSYSTSTTTTTLELYVTTTFVTQTVGYVTAFTTSYTTQSGVLAIANVTSCQYIVG